MNEEKKVPPTQAEKWVQLLKERASGLTAMESDRAARFVSQADAEYPNQPFWLVDSRTEKLVGRRRVFGDRSYCDLMFDDQSLGKINYGVMTKGMLGTAQNGRMIH